jgi:outer membrane protein insertion porin family
VVFDDGAVMIRRVYPGLDARRLRAVLSLAWLAATVGGVALGQTPTASGGSSTQVNTPAAAVVQSAPVPQAAQSVPAAPTTAQRDLQAAGTKVADEPGLKTTIFQWNGLKVDAIRFEGVTFGPDDALPKQLPQQAGSPLDPEKVRNSLRRLFASGRYRTIGVSGIRNGDSVTLIFSGPSRYFVGRVNIEGVKGEQLASLLEYSTNLNPGAPYVETAVPTATTLVKQTLAQNGYYQPVVSVTTTPDDASQQINVTFRIDIGPQARIGNVAMEGSDPGITLEEFRKKSKLKEGRKVTRETTSNALTRLRGLYQKKDRLEATVALQKSTYDQPKKQLNYDFHANQGPVVKVSIEGVKLSTSRLHLLVPIFEEGTIDNDLLNEGTHNILEFLEQQGYFDATVEVKVIGENTPSEQVVYSVDRGVKHKVTSVTLKGNKYFESDLLKERMKVQKADAYQRSGRYSPALVDSDISSIQALYRANGFNETTITQAVDDIDDGPNGKPLKTAQIRVTLTIVEGPQQKFGTIDLSGVDAARNAAVKSLLNSQQGQPFSLISLSGDRDAVLSYYLSNGFDQARVEVKQAKNADDPKLTNVAINVIEGHQVFVDHVLVSGDDRTKPKVIDNALQLHAGDPLDQSALLDTQRKLYNLALFNEVNAAVQNPDGDAARKNVLIQLREAKRWDVTYGFGFEAQTGQPASGTISPASAILLGLSPNQTTVNQEGSPGVSPRISADVTRINLFGTDKSATLHTTYGLLEKVATLSFVNPHLLGNPLLTATVSGGYSNVQNITTFKASTLQGDFRVTQKFRRTDTFIYDFQYRRVAVDPNSLQISANLIPLLSQPVRVGGPGLTWFHDTRDPSPLDAGKGSYTSVSEFLATSKFGSQSDFNRVDLTNSTYYTFGKRKYVFARNTRLGFETKYGANPNVTNTECAGVLLDTNATCDAVPLPERLYAGGATSHRGFPLNGAGPRDLQTGFPVGGNAVLVNSSELRLPASTLPYVGDGLSFVLFHDMGNVFQNISDMFPSIKRFHQPNEESCADVSKSIGTCSFNYFSHAAGVGARYKTPVGPIRVDFSYNLNPPKYPIIYDFDNNPPHEGQASHFNFFFSIGQSF